MAWVRAGDVKLALKIGQSDIEVPHCHVLEKRVQGVSLTPENLRLREAFRWHKCGGYSGAGIAATMPGSGLFRVKRVRVAEVPVNAGVRHIRSCRCPA